MAPFPMVVESDTSTSFRAHGTKFEGPLITSYGAGRAGHGPVPGKEDMTMIHRRSFDRGTCKMSYIEWL